MSISTDGHRAAPRGLVMAAFAAIYLVWGSTYLAIRFAVETIPPFLLGGMRFLAAGSALFLWLRWRGAANPSPSHWRNAAIVGALLLGVGNGCINWAEQRVTSSLTALLVAVTPLWVALLDWWRPRGTRPRLQALLGIAVGFIGVALLVGGPGLLRGTTIDPAGVAAVAVASIAWSCGSIYAKYTPKPESALMAGALQMLAGGACLAVLSVARGEPARFIASNVSAASAWAFVYLTLIGSLVGFTAFSWLLQVSSPSRIATYAYVNPVIAVFLGWALGGETLTARALGAAAVIVLGVVIITSTRSGPGPESGKTGSAPVGLTRVHESPE
jgi:drug/metabolite transporter (DMT)-like permease